MATKRPNRSRRQPNRRKATPPLDPSSGKDLPAKIGAKLRDLRLDNGLLLAEVAERTGLSQGALSEVENGHRWRKPLMDIITLARAIGCKPSAFLDEFT